MLGRLQPRLQIVRHILITDQAVIQGGGGFEMMNDRENGTFENTLAGAVTLR